VVAGGRLAFRIECFNLISQLKEPYSLTTPSAQFLDPIKAAVIIPAAAKPFVANNHFIVNTKKNAPVKISNLGGTFSAWFLGKSEVAFTGSTLRYGKLSRYSVDGPVIQGLGGEEKAETTLMELFSIMEKQRNGEAGPLLTDGYANIFYIKDVSGDLRAVCARWRGDGWNVLARQIADPLGWFEWAPGFFP
jgi:hypothetical protein